MKSSYIFFLLFISLIYSQCRWADQFTQESLLKSEDERIKFANLASFWEGKFHSHGIGYNSKSGMTYDGRRLDFKTGEPADLHFWSASSKEALHVNLLTLALEGNMQARIFFHSSTCQKNETYQQCLGKYSWEKTKDLVLDTLNRKIESYEKFNKERPGFGGQIPWLHVNDEGFVPDRNWVSRTPGLDNGQLAWSIVALNYVMKELNDPKVNPILVKYEKYLDLMKRTSPIIFYEGEGKIRTVSIIRDVNAQPFPSNYRSETPCGHPCYLDDPYEGELMAFFIDLYGNVRDKEKIWERKRPKLVSVDYPSKSGPITVVRGFWFSAHENWKFLYLPYNDIPVHKRVFVNGEK